eukprot:m51a1_g14020 hypothetical protein (541) ;mRNA; r:1106547-1108458
MAEAAAEARTRHGAKLVRFASPVISPATSARGAATTNVASVLAGPSVSSAPVPAITGDPIVCKNEHCRAVLSRSDSSRLRRDPSGRQVWRCQLCATENQVNVEKEELPTTDVVEYVIQPPQSSSSALPSTVIFCIDVSGSMCVTTELPSRRREDPKYISRLDAVKQAVMSQIDSSTNKTCISIVSFGDEVTVLGDCSQDPLVIAGDKLSDWEAVLRDVKQRAAAGPLGESRARLLTRLRELEEGGQTALGPALLASVTMAAAAGRGSKVVVCTDGIANIGLGAVEDAADAAATAEFYNRVGSLASQSGVAVSILGIKGTTCSLENLGRVADASGGAIDMADPLSLTTGFRGALDRVVLATGARASVVLHSSLGVRVDPAELEIGNVYADTEAVFSFEAVAKMPSEVPYQVQLSYTRLDGCRCMRVETGSLPSCDDTAVAERGLDVMVVGMYVSKTCARLAAQGQLSESRATAVAYRQLLSRAVHTAQQRSQMKLYDSQLRLAEENLDTAVESDTGVHFNDSAARVMYGMRGSSSASCVVQ